LISVAGLIGKQTEDDQPHIAGIEEAPSRFPEATIKVAAPLTAKTVLVSAVPVAPEAVHESSVFSFALAMLGALALPWSSSFAPDEMAGPAFIHSKKWCVHCFLSFISIHRKIYRDYEMNYSWRYIFWQEEIGAWRDFFVKWRLDAAGESDGRPASRLPAMSKEGER
jgi:hypothetical protein